MTFEARKRAWVQGVGLPRLQFSDSGSVGALYRVLQEEQGVAVVGNSRGNSSSSGSNSSCGGSGGSFGGSGSGNESP